MLLKISSQKRRGIFTGVERNDRMQCSPTGGSGKILKEKKNSWFMGRCCILGRCSYINRRFETGRGRKR